MNEIIKGNCSTELKKLEDKSVNCCVTSPPYWRLRDYGTSEWEGGNADCDHKQSTARNDGQRENIDGFHGSSKKDSDKGAMNYKNKCGKCGAIRIDNQIGLESKPEEYVEKIVQIFREVKRVLKDDGTLWLNLGDSYAREGGQGSGISRHWDGRENDPGGLHDKKALAKNIGLKPKDLVGIPWMVAFALRADGWYLRMDIIWHKKNPMPESVNDRPTRSHEYIFLMSKSKKYYYDQDAIKTPLADSSISRLSQDIEGQAGSSRVPNKTNGPMKAVRPSGIVRDRLLNYDSKEKLLRPNVKRGEFEKESDIPEPNDMCNKKSVWTVNTKPFKEAHFATFPQELILDCIKAGCPKDGIVLDPFMGAGTTALVARKLNRNYIGFELNESYIKIANQRLHKELGIFI